MIPLSFEEEEIRLAQFKAKLRQSDIDFDEHTMEVHWAGTSATHPEGYISANFSGETLTFDQLKQASNIFGTHHIDIGCEHGCASDPCHERVITFWGALGL